MTKPDEPQICHTVTDMWFVNFTDETLAINRHQPIACIVVEPIRHVMPLSTTTKSTSSLVPVFTFVVVNLAVPYYNFGVSLVPFHITSFSPVCHTWFVRTNLWFIVFMSAPVSSWILILHWLTSIIAVIRFCFASPVTPNVSACACNQSSSFSGSSASSTQLIFFRQFALKWLGPRQCEQIFPHAGHLRRHGSCE